MAPDTSPRGTGTPGADSDWDFGFGAGFYVDATRAPWAEYWRMYSYVTAELPRVLAENFPIDPKRQGIFGHSMGGHGALVAALRNPGQYRSVSAFAPIAAPSRSPWGRKAFSGYLGEDRNQWSAYDASELVSIGNAAQQLGVTRPTIYRWMDEKQLNYVRDDMSGRTFVVRRDIERRKEIEAGLKPL